MSTSNIYTTVSVISGGIGIFLFGMACGMKYAVYKINNDNNDKCPCVPLEFEPEKSE